MMEEQRIDLTGFAEKMQQLKQQIAQVIVGQDGNGKDIAGKAYCKTD